MIDVSFDINHNDWRTLYGLAGSRLMRAFLVEETKVLVRINPEKLKFTALVLCTSHLDQHQFIWPVDGVWEAGNFGFILKYTSLQSLLDGEEKQEMLNVVRAHLISEM